MHAANAIAQIDGAGHIQPDEVVFNAQIGQVTAADRAYNPIGATGNGVAFSGGGTANDDVR